jgi:hypothetical protein
MEEGNIKSSKRKIQESKEFERSTKQKQETSKSKIDDDSSEGEYMDGLSETDRTPPQSPNVFDSLETNGDVNDNERLKFAIIVTDTSSRRKIELPVGKKYKMGRGRLLGIKDKRYIFCPLNSLRSELAKSKWNSL